MTDDYSNYPAYAVYQYKVNRIGTNLSIEDEVYIDSNDMSFPQEPKNDGNFSLSMISTSLQANQEKGLRLFLASRLGRGTLFHGTGQITTIELQNLDEKSCVINCYYCLMKHPSTDLSDSLSEDRILSHFCSSEFIFCFLSPVESLLELFKIDLDRYCAEMMEHVSFNLLIDFELREEKQNDELSSSIQRVITNWFEEIFSCLFHIIEFLGNDVKYLIHAALLNRNVIVAGKNEKLKKEIMKFINICSISGDVIQHENNETKLEELEENNVKLLNMTDLRVSKQNCRESVILTLCENTHSFDNAECTELCNKWAQALLKENQFDDPVYFRQIIENYKLKSIQDLNTLKRSLRHAEYDYYSLYKAYIFLKLSGNAPVLLEQAEIEQQTVSETCSSDIIVVLKQYFILSSQMRDV